jgi:hypothetical protein
MSAFRWTEKPPLARLCAHSTLGHHRPDRMRDLIFIRQQEAFERLAVGARMRP